MTLATSQPRASHVGGGDSWTRLSARVVDQEAPLADTAASTGRFAAASPTTDEPRIAPTASEHAALRLKDMAV